MQLHVHGEPQVPCFFIFGDSLADNGNNNLLPTKARANYPPYGIDFPNGPTGRFTNGRTTVDIIAELLGFDKHIPPFANTNGFDILKGVNYASASAGIREETGKHLGTCISLNGQLKNHHVTVLGIERKLGGHDSAINHLKQCLYTVGMGGNDYINNYFMPRKYLSSRHYGPEQYAEVLIKQYSLQLRALYNNGARKFALSGLGLIGCLPYSMNLYGTNGSACVNNMNTAAQSFNKKLISLVDYLNKDLTDAKFIYLNTYGMVSGDPKDAGFTVINVGCCKVGDIGQCKPSETPCNNRNVYAFWDSFHPTEALNQNHCK
uniref:GDSL esterase/lipase n=1 Tax=Fagus sylvatica TaxID=28930 RepID=A0A2N9I076_FAGSY